MRKKKTLEDSLPPKEKLPKPVTTSAEKAEALQSGMDTFSPLWLCCACTLFRHMTCWWRSSTFKFHVWMLSRCPRLSCCCAAPHLQHQFLLCLLQLLVQLLAHNCVCLCGIYNRSSASEFKNIAMPTETETLEDREEFLAQNPGPSVLSLGSWPC